MSRICVLLCLIPILLGAQTRQIDSLRAALKNAPDDTAKVAKLNNLNKMLWQAGNYNACIENCAQTLSLAQKLNYKPGCASALVNTGVAYRNKGDYSKALDYYFQGLKINEELKDSAGIAKVLNNIGLVYNNTHDNAKALKYYMRALAIDERLGNQKSIATRLGNIGAVYFDKKEYNTAMTYYLRALQIDQGLKNIRGEAKDLGSIGSVYASLGDSARERGNMPLAITKYYNLAGEYYRRALKIYVEIEDKNGVSIFLGNIGQLYSISKNYPRAEKYIKEALAIAQEIDDLYLIKDQEEFLTDLYDKMGLFKLALEHYKYYLTARDSIFNEENTKKQVRSEMNYEFDKREAATRLEQEKKEVIAQAETRRHKIILYAISGFGLLILIFAVFAWRSFLQKKKANEEISRQKSLIEEKQKEILDSIHYARRIQQSLLPNEKYVAKTLGRLKT